ncbi:hypothetical protein D3C79_1048020 [compost metagenome]
MQRQTGFTEVLIKVAAEVTRRFRQTQRQCGYFLQRQWRIPCQFGEMLGVVHQLNTGIRQRLRLEMEFLQRGKLKKSDANIHGMCRQRLE